MVDYYVELNINNSLGIADINKELSKLESTWKRREITNPEKATTMLALIIQARKVFASDASRRTYDKELDSSRKKQEKADPDKERRETLDKWKEQAEEYYESGQYDLAKIAVEKALSLSSANGDDDDLFALAADIYNDNGDQNTALDYINRAIVAAPDVSYYYISKGLIYDRKVSTVMQSNGYGHAANFRSEARKMFQLAEAKAEQNGDLANRALACGALAFSLYFQEPMDKKAGEDYANLAMKYGGDSWGNAERVLNAVRKAAEAAEAAERQRKEYEARQKAEQQKREREEQRRREEEQKAREELHRKQEEIRHKRKCWNRLFIISIILCVLYFLSPLLLAIKPSFAYICLADYFIYSSLLCMSWAVESDELPIGPYLCCLFFGACWARGIDQTLYLSLPFGKFMIAWCIIVGIFSIIGVRIGDSLSREEGRFKC